MNDKKIILSGNYIGDLVQSGPDKFTKRLFDFLSKNKFNVVLLDYFNKSKRNSFLEAIIGKKNLGNNIYRLGIFHLIWFIIKIKPTHIHITNLDKYHIFIFILKRFIKFKIITTFHSFYHFEVNFSHVKKNIYHKIMFKLVEKLAIKTSDFRVFVSEQLLDLFRKNFQEMIWSNNIVIYNGIDEEFYCQPDLRKFNYKLNIIFYNGYNNYIYRGINEVYEVLKNIKKNVKVNLYIIGSTNNSIKSTENLRIINIRFLPQKELIEILKNMHLVIKGPTFDSFPIFVLECMAMGLIPIVHSQVGISKFIIDGENGYIYKTDKMNDIPLIIEKLVKMPDLMKKISLKASLIKEIVTWEKCFKSYIDLYQRN